MKLMHGVIFAVFAVGSRPILAATLMMNYDASDANSWTEGALKDTAGNGQRLVAAGGQEGDDYGAPVYVAEGAGEAGRAYFDFQKFGMLTGSNAQGGMLNNPEATKPATGYTMETYLRISSDARVKANAGIGAHNSTGYQNQFINLQKADNEGRAELVSSTALWDGTGPDMELPEEERGRELEKHYFVQENKLEDFIPRDEWVHVVKVHDPETNGGQIRWYINGKLAGTFDFSEGAAGDRYPDRGDGFGDVGEPPRPWDPGDRTIMGLGFSFFRLYQGVLSEQEIAERFEAVTKPSAPKQ
jgi:hypothetical protein